MGQMAIASILIMQKTFLGLIFIVAVAADPGTHRKE
jgi:hypothetical protein